MSKIVECRACKKEISNSIDTCPHCGEKNPYISKTKILWFWISVLTIGYFIYLLASSSKTITKESFSGRWPFSVNQVVLNCYISNETKLPVVTIDGNRYGLTGYANNLHGSFDDINAINKYWLDDENNKGLKISLSDVLDEAIKLCN